jgi:plastocyanin
LRKAADRIIGRRPGGKRTSLLGLGALATLAVLALALSACGSSSSSSATTAQSQEGAENIKLVVKSDEEKAKKGSDGNWHDAFLPADFSVEAGDTVNVTVYNYDDMPHTFTAADLGVNQKIAAGSEEKPSKTTFTFTAPRKSGSYEWFCALPCDPWAMNHSGFMRGHVTVA